MIEINGYEIGRLLGTGAFGETYKAKKNGTTVALKLIREEAIQRDVDVRRFQREVRAIQKAVGQNVVRLLDSGMGRLGNEIRYYIALEYLEGKNLAETFKDANFKFNDPILKSILLQTINGLETVHGQNIIHRDLKPANIFFTNDSLIKLLDFGLVKMLDYTTLTIRPGQPIGTPLYIAPEILLARTVDYRADFYSLGVLIYYLTTNEYPFYADTPFELYARVINEPPRSPTKYNSKISSDFENLILRLLSKEPYQRFNSHEELKNAIEDIDFHVSKSKKLSVASQRTYPKKWFFNVMHNEGSEVRNFIENGGELQGVLYPAHFLPKYRATLKLLQEHNIHYIIDPSTPKFAYSTFAKTKGLVELPYLPDRNTVLAPSGLGTIDKLQKYAKGCIDWQIYWKSSGLVAPYHFCRNLDSEWLDVDIKLLEESVSYVKKQNYMFPVLAGICLGHRTLYEFPK